MRIDLALLCEAVTIRDGLFHILGGGITRISAENFPTPINGIMALRVIIEQGEAQGRHELKLMVQGPDGEELGTYNLDFGVNSPEQSGNTAEVVVPLSLPLHSVNLPAPGAYSVEVMLDGAIERSIRVEAVQRQRSG